LIEVLINLQIRLDKKVTPGEEPTRLVTQNLNPTSKIFQMLTSLVNIFSKKLNSFKGSRSWRI